MTAPASFGPDIWIAEGPVVSFYGFPYPTRMVVIRLGDGSLFLWSPIALTPELKAEVEALGPVAHLVSPNKIHYLFLKGWKDAYPDARIYALDELKKRKPALPIDAVLEDTPDQDWANDIDQVIVRGSFAMSEAVFFHRKSRTAIFADLIENFSPDWFKGWRGVLARLDGIVSPHPGAPREWRLSFRNRKMARSALDRILSWQPEQVVMAHGIIVRNDGVGFIRRAFGWLLKWRR
jgi:hypothetical protein